MSNSVVESTKPKNSNVNRVSILELNDQDAKEFFLKGENYFNAQLPSYFEFDNLLSGISSILDAKPLSSLSKTKKAKDQEGVNYTILDNKDGKFAWRPIELIHPAIYVSLVHEITKNENWKLICAKFKEFNALEKINCFSLPVRSLSNRKNAAEQLSLWWEEVEQKSIELALDYDYVFHTDITDCYGSIYTHSISWALHEKTEAKSRRFEDNLLGNIVDCHIQNMRQGQTNGIPQGSVLLDFIAEMVLGYADLMLHEKLEKIDDYFILRYRDDYRIFVNNPQDGEKILKCLTEVMFELGLQLNPQKTKSSQTLIRDAIKPDKLHWLCRKQEEKNQQKHLLIIHDHASMFPNSGSLHQALIDYFNTLDDMKMKNTVKTIMSLVSIVVDIAYHSPRTFPVVVTILSHLISLVDDETKKEIIERIQKKFEKIPNTGFMQIWLQYLVLSASIDVDFNEPICKLAKQLKAQTTTGEKSNLITIWKNDWISSEELRNAFKIHPIINIDKINTLLPRMPIEEVELFNPWY